ncbi:hypothetical protein YC2023_044080 [Brassica napus]
MLHYQNNNLPPHILHILNLVSQTTTSSFALPQESRYLICISLHIFSTSFIKSKSSQHTFLIQINQHKKNIAIKEGYSTQKYSKHEGSTTYIKNDNTIALYHQCRRIWSENSSASSDLAGELVSVVGSGRRTRQRRRLFSAGSDHIKFGSGILRNRWKEEKTCLPQSSQSYGRSIRSAPTDFPSIMNLLACS